MSSLAQLDQYVAHMRQILPGAIGEIADILDAFGGDTSKAIAACSLYLDSELKHEMHGTLAAVLLVDAAQRQREARTNR